VYGIDVIDHTTGLVVRKDYVGQTRQRGRARENQHRDDQPWSDLIKGSPRVLWEGVCTDTELDEMERHFIQDVTPRPRLNWKLNEDNPQQIPKWVLVEQRHQRDDEEGRLRWQPPGERPRGSLLDWDSAPVRSGPPRRPRWVLKPWQRTAAAVVKALGWWLLAEAGTTVVGWAAFTYWHWGGWRQTLIGAALILPGFVLLYLFAVCRFARKTRRRVLLRRMVGLGR
jgi:hypothetical protein